MRATVVSLALLAALGTPAAAVGPTDIARVDEYIDAPRELFGRTRAELERRLGAPSDVRARTGSVLLSWPGVEIALSRTARVAGVVLKTSGRPLPHGLDVGAPRARVEDGFFRDGRVTRIEWQFWTE